MTTCDRIDDLRDYAMGELAADARSRMERHIAGCGECAAELTSLQLTTTALRSVADREVPQRIGFVSDKIFEPSPVSRWFADSWFAGFWNSAARLGFASACVLAAAIVISVYHPFSRGPAPVQLSSLAQTSISKADVDREINEAVAHAVTQAVAQVRTEDAGMSAKALAAADQRHEQQHQALLAAMDENMTILQKRLSTYTMLASNDAGRFGDGR
jgi:anti-sigma-K factor RskA